MGMKDKTWLAFRLLFLVLFMSMSSVVWAQENMCIVPTGTQSVAYPVNWGSSVLNVYTSNQEVPRGQSVEVWAESESHGCPPYQWQVSGTGFHFNNISGPTSAETGGDGETLQLWADSTACGSATIVVTDGCSQPATAYVRSTEGEWVFDSNICVDDDDHAGDTLWGLAMGEYCYRASYMLWDPYQVVEGVWDCDTRIQDSPCFALVKDNLGSYGFPWNNGITAANFRCGGTYNHAQWSGFFMNGNYVWGAMAQWNPTGTFQFKLDRYFWSCRR